MRQRVLIRVLLFTACAVQLRAQTPPSPQIVKQEELAVRITFENERPVPPNIRVELLSIYGSTVQIGATDNSGMVRFTGLNPAKYKLRIAGDQIVTTETGEIDMTDSGPRITQSVQVRRGLSTTDAAPRVTLDVNVPPEARKEFDKGSGKMERKDWNDAEIHLERAIAIYPKYALAHNNLAVVYVHLNQGEKAVESFRTAAQLDEHLQPANLYLGQFYYDNKDFKQAEPYLLRAASADPRNPQILLALANSQMQNGEAAPALANAQKVHTLPDHKKFAIAHVIAGQILSDRRESAKAREEYRQFLQEDPDSPMAPRVKDALTKLEAASK
jgi:Tfp pilus assembly protein PilF